jgi:hypothetical protein
LSATGPLTIAALLQDLKQRGLLKDTLPVWGGEFGRTPTAQTPDGRDHDAAGFSMWMGLTPVYPRGTGEGKWHPVAPSGTFWQGLAGYGRLAGKNPPLPSWLQPVSSRAG